MVVHLSSEEEVVHPSAGLGAGDGKESGLGQVVRIGNGEYAKWVCAPGFGHEPFTNLCVFVAPGSAPSEFSTFVSQSKEEQEKSSSSKFKFSRDYPAFCMILLPGYHSNNTQKVSQLEFFVSRKYLVKIR